MLLCQRLCPTGSSTIEAHSYRRRGGRHPHQGPRKNKVCSFQGEDGDGKESISVVEMDKCWSCSATISSGSAIGNMMQHVEREL